MRGALQENWRSTWKNLFKICKGSVSNGFETEFETKKKSSLKLSLLIRWDKKKSISNLIKKKLSQIPSLTF